MQIVARLSCDSYNSIYGIKIYTAWISASHAVFSCRREQSEYTHKYSMDAGKGKFYLKCLGMQQSEPCLFLVGSPCFLPLHPRTATPRSLAGNALDGTWNRAYSAAESSANVLTAFRVRLWWTLDTLLSFWLYHLLLLLPSWPAVPDNPLVRFPSALSHPPHTPHTAHIRRRLILLFCQVFPF